MTIDLPVRHSARALLFDDAGDVLLVEHATASGPVWTAPGGGIEPGEDPVAAVRRELFEEVGLTGEGPGFHLVWTQRLDLPEFAVDGWSAVVNHVYAARVERFEPSPGVNPEEPGHPSGEGVGGVRWWSADAMSDAARSGILFGPRDLPRRWPALLIQLRTGGQVAPAVIDGV
ncbi:NUDIX hydrolase [Actinotalea sp. M2MS4P-6]|uniref:NUDIX domain-containing protein n=1 Tax=Actinotalea sp. M2MS4P-6 TaxID=2983762 RepID=UPI0021E4F1BF|nr:NUDIX hydrolase [Actinotalea sp. M2MS4P-6]MCV2393648.1 NUDIX hydrolase [Actinotalea sp. M2MS4P-6]